MNVSEEGDMRYWLINAGGPSREDVYREAHRTGHEAGCKEGTEQVCRVFAEPAFGDVHD